MRKVKIITAKIIRVYIANFISYDISTKFEGQGHSHIILGHHCKKRNFRVFEGLT